MKTLKEQNYTINICNDIIEWAKEFYGMPEGSVLENKNEVSSECMGFASIEEKTIWVFIPEKFDLNDLKETVSHELGHIVEGGFKNNPDPRMKKMHEAKANHYMAFYMIVDSVLDYILDSK